MISINYFRKQLNLRKLSTVHKKTIGSTIKHQRKKFNMTLEEGSEGICSVSYLSKVENNMIEPSEKFLPDFAKRFHLSENETKKEKEIEELYHQIIETTFLNDDVDTSMFFLDEKSYQGKLTHYISMIINNDFSNTRAYHEELSTYIKNFNDDELVLYVLFTSIELYYKGQHKLASELNKEILDIDIKQKKLSLLIRYWNLKNAFGMSNYSIVIADYRKLLNELIDYEFFERAQMLKIAYLDYMARFEGYQDFKNEVNKLISTDKEIKFFLLAKNLYYHKEYDKALELLESSMLEDSMILRIKILDVKNSERQLMLILGEKRNFMKNKNAAVFDFYRIKYKLKKYDILDYLKDEVVLNDVWVDDVETNLFFLEQGLKEYQIKNYYKDGTIFSQYITRKLMMLIKK